MTLKSQIAADLANTVFNTDEFATSITYTPRNGTATTISAVLGADLDAYQETDLAEYSRRTMEITVPRASDIGVVDPDKDDTVTISDEEWSVVRIVRQDDNLSVLEISRAAIGDRRGASYHTGGQG